MFLFASATGSTSSEMPTSFFSNAVGVAGVTGDVPLPMLPTEFGSSGGSYSVGYMNSRRIWTLDVWPLRVMTAGRAMMSTPFFWSSPRITICTWASVKRPVRAMMPGATEADWPRFWLLINPSRLLVSVA